MIEFDVHPLPDGGFTVTPRQLVALERAVSLAMPHLRQAPQPQPPGTLAETLLDCANALDEVLPAKHPYRRIVAQARALLAAAAP